MSAPTRGSATVVNGTASGSAAVALAANGSRNFLQIQNTHATQTINYTIDGSTPVSGGAGNFLAAAGGSATYDTFCPTGAVTIIASGSGTTYTINWF